MIFLLIKCITAAKVLSWNLEMMQLILMSQGMQYSVFTASEGSGTGMVKEVYYQDMAYVPWHGCFRTRVYIYFTTY